MHDQESTITVVEGEYLTQQCSCCTNMQARIEGRVNEHGEDVLWYMVVWGLGAPTGLNIVLSLRSTPAGAAGGLFCLHGRHMRGGFGVGFVDPEDIEMETMDLPFLSRAEAIQHPEQARLFHYWDHVCLEDSRLHGVIEATRPKQRRRR